MSAHLVPITFRVLKKSADQIDRLAHEREMSRGEVVRELVVDALAALEVAEKQSNPSDEIGANLMSQLRELVDRLGIQLARLAEVQTKPQSDPVSEEFAALPEQVNRLIDAISQLTSTSRILNMDHSEVRELRKQTARMLGMLYQYRTGDENSQTAREFAEELFTSSTGPEPNEG